METGIRESVSFVCVCMGYTACPAVLLVAGKTDPLQAWSGLEGSRELRFPDFIATAQEWW